MALFQLLGTPVAVVFILTFLYKRHETGPENGWALLTVQALKGLLCSVPALLTWLAASADAESSYRPARLYARLLLRDHVVWYGWGILFVALLLAVPRRRYRPDLLNVLQRVISRLPHHLVHAHCPDYFAISGGGRSRPRYRRSGRWG